MHESNTINHMHYDLSFSEISKINLLTSEFIPSFLYELEHN